MKYKKGVFNHTIQDLEKYSSTVGIQGLALSEQARRVTDGGGGGAGIMKRCDTQGSERPEGTKW